MSTLRNILILSGIGAGVYFISKQARTGGVLSRSKIECFPGPRFLTDCTEVIELTLPVGSVWGRIKERESSAYAPGVSNDEVRMVSGSMRLGAVQMLVRYPGGSEAEAFSTDPMTAASYLNIGLPDLIAVPGSDVSSLVVRSAPGPRAKIDLANSGDVDPYDTDVEAKVLAGLTIYQGVQSPRKPGVSIALSVGDWMKGATIELRVDTFAYVRKADAIESLSPWRASVREETGASSPYRAVYKFFIEVT